MYFVPVGIVPAVFFSLSITVSKVSGIEVRPLLETTGDFELLAPLLILPLFLFMLDSCESLFCENLRSFISYPFFSYCVKLLGLYWQYFHRSHRRVFIPNSVSFICFAIFHKFFN